MPDFTISDRGAEAYEPDKPTTGEYEWLFRHAGDEGTRVVPGDRINDAWKAMRYHEGESWFEWMLVGRNDIKEADDRVRETAIGFARRNSTLVDKWEEADGENT